MSEWQPIETAPKDGTPFRVYAPSLIDLDFNPGGSAEAVYDPERIIAAKWDGQHDVWATVFVDDATDWMPLPPPPRRKLAICDCGDTGKSDCPRCGDGSLPQLGRTLIAGIDTEVP